jgi:Fic family protein
MVSIRKKKIKNNSYLYAEHSFRLPDGSVKKLSKFIKDEEEAKSPDLSEYFQVREHAANEQYALTTYRKDHVLTEKKLKKVELFRTEYQRIHRRLSPAQLQDVIHRFTINFTYESNAIEGNSLTLKDVALVLTEHKMPAGRELREVYETRNTRLANELLFRGKVKIGIQNILDLHKTLVRDTGVPTGFKRVPNFLLMRDVRTTPPESVEEEMEKLIAWYKATKDHPLRLAAEFHARFERIHPFEDGNGRVGRVLLNAILREHGYPPLIIRKTSRIAYLAALAAHDNGHHAKLARFLLEKFEQTFEKFFRVYVKYL